MKNLIFPIISLFLLAYAISLTKDKEEIARLEKETCEAEQVDYLSPIYDKIEERGTNCEKSSPILENVSSSGEKTLSRIPFFSISAAEAGELENEKKEFDYQNDQEIKDGSFTVQIAALRNRAAAESLMSVISTDGLKVFISEVASENGIYYRVRVGSFSEYSEARKFGRDLEKKYSIRGWIARNN
jgi:hypothetical protein